MIGPNILFVHSDGWNEWNCSEHRCFVPFRALRRAGYHVEIMDVEKWKSIDAKKDAASITADLIILQRNAFDVAINKISYWKAMGKAVVVDLDDAYELMTEATGAPSYEFWKYGRVEQNGKPATISPKPIEQLKWGVKIAGAVSSPSNVILDDWDKYGVRKYFIPNYLQMDVYKRHPVHKELGKIYIGGGGSMTHLESWRSSGVTKALQQICKKYPQVMVVVCGDQRVCGTLGVKATQIAYSGWQPYMLYSKSLSYLDIGLLPLSGEYDRRRSSLKAAEYIIMGIPWIASDLEPYHDMKCGLVVKNTVEEWFSNMEAIINSLEELKPYVEADRIEAIKEFDIDLHVGDLIKTYERIINENI
jgi:glycosyltransferase involved in cell wall biosynthesis